MEWCLQFNTHTTFMGFHHHSIVYDKFSYYNFLTVGLSCLFLSTMYLPTILFTSRNFAFLYTLGNVLLFGSVSFIVGPMQQLKTMTERSRIIPSVIFASSSVMSLVAAIQMQNVVIVMFLIIVQLLSVIWYMLTYIPMGERMVGWVWSAFRSVF